MIRHVRPEDAAAICGIYNEYVRNSTATFEETPVAEEEMGRRIVSTAARYPWLVFESDNMVAGYTYARSWRDRAAYRNTVETGTYLAPQFTGRGFGSLLKAALITELRNSGFHAIVSGIALPNPASVALCEKFGFVKVAHFRQVGFKMGRWIDVGYWQLLL